jgi:hypothetical protein
MKKILILVIACNKDPYIDLERECREMWAAYCLSNITILFLHSSLEYSDSFLDGSTLYVNGAEEICNVGYKMLHAFSYCLQNIEFDYIYRTNLSSYINQIGLYNYAQSLPDNNVYKGVVGQFGNISFASGCGYFISKDLVRYVVEYKNRWNHKLIDDVALAQLLKTINVVPEPVERIDIITNESLVNFNVETIGSCFHFRCKSETDRTHDVRVMKMLHNYFSTKQELV